ncbi:uncharacterized protein [Ptychodera flava]|uniref:uncharacterized protein n=1 Tax=Ptychodera flava TaxID=63121 RepID=UPI00396A80EF
MMVDFSAALFLSTSWKNNSYGPATWQLISDFCEETLKKKPDKLTAIYCTVLDVEVSEEQKEDASRHGVTLIPATRSKWLDPDEDLPAVNWLIHHNTYYPELGKLKNVGHVVGLSVKIKNAAAAIHENLFIQAEFHQMPSRLAALFVSDVWKNDELGLTGFHRSLVQDFCERKTKAGEVLKAYSTILDVKITDDQKKDAESCGVTLIPAKRKTQVGPKDDPQKLEWLLNHELYYPDLKELEDVQYVVGYAPKTGHAANYIRAKLFPKAKLVLINHACPESACLEAEEYGLFEFEEKMLQMASKADLLFSIGPVIYEHFQNAYRAEFHGKDLSEIPHEEILPIPPACFRGKDPVLRNTTKHSILTCGQIDTQKAIERCETMAVSIGTAANLLSESNSNINPPLWKIQGVSPQDNQTVVIKFLSDKMQCRHIQPTFHPGHSAKILHRSLQQSHLCLPAPCYIDYSFYGFEAVVCGLPTAVCKYTHLAHFVEKYLKEHADQVVVEDTGTKLSEKILKHLQDTPLAFQRAMTLKKDLLQSEVLSESCARLASLLTTTIQQQNGATCSSKDEGSMRNGKDCLTVQIGLEENVQQQDLKDLEEEVKALPAQVRQQLMEEMMTKVRAALKRRVEDVLGHEEGCQEIKKVCKQKLGDVDPSSLTAKSLAILLRFLTLYNLYRLKQTCRSGSLARAFEPLLITDEMREFAAKVGIKLHLKATYDQEQFREVELFFIKRDGSGIQPMTMYSDVQSEDSVEDTKFSSSAEETSLSEGKFTDSFLGDKKQNKELFTLMLLKLDPVHEIHQSTETNVCSLFKAEEYIRQKGNQFDIIQVVMTMTDRIQHILSSRQEILSLLSVTRYLVTDVKCPSLTFHELDEQLTQHGTLTPPITVINETLSLQARSLLPLQSSEQQLTDSDIRYLTLAQPSVQSLQSQLNTEKSKLQTKKIVGTRLNVVLTEKSLLKKQCQEYMTIVSVQHRKIQSLTDRLEKSKSQLKTKDKFINELRTRLEQVSDAQTDIELQQKVTESLQIGENVISEVEQTASCQPDLRLPSSPDDCGHFHLPLLLLSRDIDKRSLNARYDSISKQLENETGHFRYGILNMLGLLEFQKGEKVKACQTFTEIFEKDPTNLNALSNLTTVYECMNIKQKAKDYKDQLTEVFEDQGRLSGEERQAVLLRCFAEQAYSLAFDCFDEKTKTPPKYEEAISMYELLLKESENVAAVDGERFKWKMCMGIRQYMKLTKDWQLWNKSGREDKEATKEMITLLQLLKDILDNCGDGFYKFQCWCYIGMLLINGRCLIDARSHPENLEKLRELDLVNCYEQPSLCFQAAETCYDGGWKELVKFAKLLIKDKQYEYALQVIEKSLAKNPDKSNWHAYEQRANIYIKMYDKQSQGPVKQGEVPDKTPLTKAEADLELCLEVMDYSPTILLEMARLQIRLFQNRKRRFDFEVEDRDALEKAFKILAKIKNTGDIDKYTYAVYLGTNGDCLMYDKEYSDAAAKYEEAILCHGGHYGNFSALLNALFRRLRQHRQYSILDSEDLADIVMKIQKYHGLYEKEYIYKTFKNLSRTFHEEFSDVDNYSFTKTGMKLREIIEHSSAGESQVEQ